MSKTLYIGKNYNEENYFITTISQYKFKKRIKQDKKENSATMAILFKFSGLVKIKDLKIEDLKLDQIKDVDLEEEVSKVKYIVFGKDLS